MKEARVAAIMAQMDVKSARELTVMLANRVNLPAETPKL